jgi:signal transduction histidine kinase
MRPDAARRCLSRTAKELAVEMTGATPEEPGLAVGAPEGRLKHLRDPLQKALFLLEAGRTLGSSLDFATTLAELAELCVPRLGDWCVLTVVDADGAPRRVEVRCADPAMAELATQITAQPPPPLPSKAQLWSQPTITELRSLAVDAHGLQLLQRMQIVAAIAVPIQSHGRVLGRLTLVSSQPRRQYEAADVELVQEIATRAALALDHAALYRESQQARIRSEEQARRLFVLAEASRVLAEAGFDFDVAYRAIVRCVCEHVGDACVLTIAAKADGKQRPVAIDHTNPSHRELLLRASAHGIGLGGPVYESGRAMRLAVMPPGAFAEAVARKPQLGEYIRDVGISSMLVVPLRMAGQVIGTLGVARDAGGRAYTEEDEALLQDLADRAALVLDKARLYQEAQEALSLRESFISVASHELRTPLSTMRLHVQGHLRKLHKVADQLPENTVEKFEAVDAQITRLIRLVEELLDVSRIGSGRINLDLGEFDLAQLVKEVSTRLSPALQEAKCAFELTVETAPTGRWDRSRIDQVLTNLLSNALKYGRGEPVALTVTAREGRAVVSVRDGGIGIAPEHQQRIFERFERAVSNRHYSGFGLGLWISRQLARAHGGDIRVISVPDEGSTFTLELPLG